MEVIFDRDTIEKHLQELQEFLDDEKSWNDQKAFVQANREKTALENKLNSFLQLQQETNDLLEMFEISQDDVTLAAELEKSLLNLHTKLKKREIECLFSEDCDKNSCYFDITAGSGGTESQDWANMLLRMYLMWAKNHNFSTEIVDKLDGEEVGVKSVTVKVEGENAYGWLKNEIGVHRLVRISPFDSNKRRHTSFASFYTYPIVEDDAEIEIKNSDLKIDTFRASGAGGQHVNKTESAVRITHIPSGVIVQCQNGRSQYANKENCLKMLRAKLSEIRRQEKEKEANLEHNQKASVSWGNQIRSYVLHPYQMIKDLRSGIETGKTADFLDGEIDDFLLSNLVQKK